MDNPSNSQQSEGQINQQSLTKIAPDVSVPPLDQVMDSGPVLLEPNSKNSQKRNLVSVDPNIGAPPGHRRNETGNLRDSIEIGVEPREKEATAIVSSKKDIGPNVDAPPAEFS